MRKVLEVTSAASNFDLTELATVKSEMGISASTYDTLLGKLITQQSKRIAEYCHRVFAKETVKETIWPEGESVPILVLDRYPLASVSSITEDGTTVDSGDYTVDTITGQVIREATNALGEFSAGKIIVTYIAGYDLPGDSPRTLPEDVEAACIQLVKAAYYGRDRDGALKSEAVPDVYSATYRTSADLKGGMPEDIAAMLAPYVTASI